MEANKKARRQRCRSTYNRFQLQPSRRRLWRRA